MKQIWWTQVTNAVLFISKITETLIDEKSVIISYSKNMPWPDYFTETIKDIVKQQNSEKKFENIFDVNDPGKYILKEFCKSEKRAEYRPSKGYAKFFAESNDIVLHDRYLWVKISNLEMLEKWTSFVSDYCKERDKEQNSAVFILVLEGEEQINNKKGIKSFIYDDYIGEYDRVVFSMLASSRVKKGTMRQYYLAELVSKVVENDIELCASCIKNERRFLADPYSEIQRIITDDRRSNGEEYVFLKNETEVSRSIWLAQIRTIYPIIEEFREGFVEQHKEAIAEQLPISSSYGEEYSEPEDVEIGTLKYMADNGNLNISSNDYEKLKRFKEARNKLSHLTALTLEEIAGLGL